MPETLASDLDLRIEAFGATDVGFKRTCNEDVALVRDDLGLYVVCDGAGGHDSGDVAAAAAARAIAKYVTETRAAAESEPVLGPFGVPSDARRIAAALHRGNRDVLAIAKAAASKKGMGATCVALLFTPRAASVHVAHAGDSRCYRFRSGHLEQLTLDHSVINDVIEQRPDLEDAVIAKLPRHAVTRALGMDAKLRISVTSHEVVDGDRFLLCTDGLSGPVPARAIADVLGRGDPPDQSVAALIDLAKAAGAPDNVAALVVDCSGPRSSELPVVEGRARVLTPVSRSSEPELLLLGIEELELETLAGGDGHELERILSELLGRSSS